MDNQGSAAAIGIVFMLVLIAVGVLIGTFLVPAVLNKPPDIHEALIDECSVIAVIHSQLSAELEPVLLKKHDSQKIVALDIMDVVKRAHWVDQEVTMTEWSWTYQGQPLAYMKISGPHNDQLYVEFSRCTLTELTVEVLNNTRTFEVAWTDQEGSGFWYLWIDLET